MLYWFAIIIFISWKQVVITWRCHDYSATNSKWNPLVILGAVSSCRRCWNRREEKEEEKTSVLVSVCRTLDIYLEIRRKEKKTRRESRKKNTFLSTVFSLSGRSKKKTIMVTEHKKNHAATMLSACVHVSSSPPISRLFIRLVDDRNLILLARIHVQSLNTLFLSAYVYVSHADHIFIHIRY